MLNLWKGGKMILINKNDPVYSDERNGKILYLETFGESALMIISLGSHPCSYVTFPGIEHISDYESANDLCDVHYGFTFLGSRENLGIKGIWLGWDYAHFGDLLYSSHFELWEENEHKWTLDELIIEGRTAITTINKKIKGV